MTVVGVLQEGTRQAGLGTSIHALLAIFYVDDVLVASPKSACLQELFDALTSFFERVGLRKNEGKIVKTAC